MNTTSPVRVLAIDDNDLLAEALQRWLRNDPDIHWTGWLGTGDNLIDAVCARRPDVVLLDIDMPGVDAFDVVAQLAARRPEARVAMFSGHLRQELIDRAVAAGAMGYISKDDSPAEIASAIRRLAAGEFVLSSAAAAAHERL